MAKPQEISDAQITDGFTIQPSDTLTVDADSNNVNGYRHVFIHNPSAGGTVRVKLVGGGIVTPYIPQGATLPWAVIQVFNTTPTPPTGLIGGICNT